MDDTLIPPVGCDVLPLTEQLKKDQLTDRELLGRFVADGDQAAFATLVHRHGPLVFNTCRRRIRHTQDAEDAFQTVFLVLARKAGAVAWRDSVAGWLYEAASRVAAEATSRATRLRVREQQHAATLDFSSPAEPTWREQYQSLDRELLRLPEKYRAPLILCYLEGNERHEAAKRLGLSLGTVKARWNGGGICYASG